LFLSRVELNPYRRETMRAIRSPETMHAAVMASFNATDDNGRILWRLDRVGSIQYLLIQSKIKPDMHHIVDQFGRPETGQKWDTLDYDQFLSKVNNGQTWRFRLKANPVHSITDPNNPEGRGRVVAHVTPEYQVKWLLDRSEKLGFRIIMDGDEPLIGVRHSEVHRFKRKDKPVTISMVIFEGSLEVTDRDLFVKTVSEGIGRAKAYGCGMITIAKM
jgi:CRISPR system Cascade subunit CasE